MAYEYTKTSLPTFPPPPDKRYAELDREEYESTPISGCRPWTPQRTFHSPAVDSFIDEMKGKMRDKDLAELFSNCWPNTLDKAIAWKDDHLVKTFVVHEDANIMSIRDSALEVISYVPFIEDDQKLRDLIRGVINLQAEYIIKDPYASTYLPPKESNLSHPQPPQHDGNSDHPPPSDLTYQTKFELASLAYFLKLSYQFWLYARDDSLMRDEKWVEAVRTVFRTLKQQQQQPPPSSGESGAVQQTGLIRSQFKTPSGSSTSPVHIASNAMVSVELARVSEMFVQTDPSFSSQLSSFSNEIRECVLRAKVHHEIYGEIFPYGSGQLMEDDASIPNLLSLPYLGFIDDEDVSYQNTRRFVLSESNKHWYRGSLTSGVGSEHTGYVWTTSLCMKILTSDNDQEIFDTFHELKKIAENSGLLPQSVWHSDREKYIKPWSPVTNSLFGETILKISRERPHLLFDESLDDEEPEESPNFFSYILGLFTDMFCVSGLSSMMFCFNCDEGESPLISGNVGENYAYEEEYDDDYDD